MIGSRPGRGGAAKRTAGLGAVVLGGWLALALIAAGAPPAGPSASLEKMLGQRIMVGVPGTSADRRLLSRVRRGYVGAVILFKFNIVSVAQTRSMVDALQAAARAGRNPPLLVAVDQEGGGVQRFAGGPPSRSPREMVAAGDPGVAYQEGLATGRYLRRAGVNMDLAPVVDVPTFAGAFIRQSGRAFSADPQVVARYAGQFARGLQAGGVAATAKHFPGVGTAGVDTDDQLDELRPTPAQVDGALVPYRALIAGGLDAVMLSTAGFPDYDGGVPAALSSTLARGWLRGKLGFRGLAITDALGTPTGHSEVVAGTLAAEAGADVLLYTDQAPGVLSALNRAGRRSRRTAKSCERVSPTVQSRWATPCSLTRVGTFAETMESHRSASGISGVRTTSGRWRPRSSSSGSRGLLSARGAHHTRALVAPVPRHRASLSGCSKCFVDSSAPPRRRVLQRARRRTRSIAGDRQVPSCPSSQLDGHAQGRAAVGPAVREASRALLAGPGAETALRGGRIGVRMGRVASHATSGPPTAASAILWCLRRPSHERQLTDCLGELARVDSAIAYGIAKALLEAPTRAGARRRSGELLGALPSKLTCSREETTGKLVVRERSWWRPEEARLRRLDWVFHPPDQEATKRDFQLAVEVKIGAGLAQNQLVDYHRHLEARGGGPSGLVVLARSVPRGGLLDDAYGRWLGVVLWEHVLARLRRVRPDDDGLAIQWPLLLDILETRDDLGAEPVGWDAVCAQDSRSAMTRLVKHGLPEAEVALRNELVKRGAAAGIQPAYSGDLKARSAGGRIVIDVRVPAHLPPRVADLSLQGTPGGIALVSSVHLQVPPKGPLRKDSRRLYDSAMRRLQSGRLDPRYQMSGRVCQREILLQRSDDDVRAVVSDAVAREFEHLVRSGILDNAVLLA